jgi:hypothetical protein
VRFDENDGSRAEQSGVCDVGDEILPRAIRRMGVGHLIPIEEHLLRRTMLYSSGAFIFTNTTIRKVLLMLTKDKLKPSTK